MLTMAVVLLVSKRLMYRKQVSEAQALVHVEEEVAKSALIAAFAEPRKAPSRGSST